MAREEWVYITQRNGKRLVAYENLRKGILTHPTVSKASLKILYSWTQTVHTRYTCKTKTIDIYPMVQPKTNG